MQYKHGKRIKYYRIKHTRWQRYAAMGSAGVLTAVLGMLGIFKLSHLNASQFFGGKHAGVDASLNRVPHRRDGSNAPAPKGTMLKSITNSPLPSFRREHCNGFPPKHAGLVNSAVPELRKLAQYEQLCDGAVADRTSIFISTPTTTQEAKTSGAWVANVLNDYAANGMKPLVFMEPTFESGGNIDLTKIAGGTYDPALTAFYKAVASAGVTDTSMGMWVYLPEDNMPNWTTSDPDVYSKVVTKLAHFQKLTFPGSQVSLMLDSESYRPGASWGDGTYVSLLPYVQNLPKGLVNSFGLQGFPWSPPANQPSEAPLDDSNTYLQVGFAMEAASKLGIKDIWLNTGTFREMYAGQSGQTIYETPVHRQQELAGVLQQAREVQSQGFNVSIHLFSQNKAGLSEGTDWSYWKKLPGDSQNSYVFSTFAHDTQAAGIPIWLYDTE